MSVPERREAFEGIGNRFGHLTGLEHEQQSSMHTPHGLRVKLLYKSREVISRSCLLENRTRDTDGVEEMAKHCRKYPKDPNFCRNSYTIQYGKV